MNDKNNNEEPKEDKTVLAAYNDWYNNQEDESLTANFLHKVEPTIKSALRTYAPGQESALKTKATIMALDVARRFKPDKKVHMNTFLMNGLKSLRRVAHQRQQPIHIPENVALEQHKLITASGELMSEKGRPATVQELADRTGMSIKRIEKVRKYKNPVSSSSLLSEKGDSLFSQQKDPQTIWADYVYHDLDPTDKKIYEWSTGYGGSKMLSKGDIAKHLKISAPAVSQRISRIIKRMEEGTNLGR